MLRDRLTPEKINFVLETLDLRRQCFSHCFKLLISTLSILISSIYIIINLFRFTERSATIKIYKF